MGRLTLNVLLSFAQFEREVTAERIRDKIAASKRKGMWMGGVVPIGYRAVERRLVPHREAAAQVREIYRRYLELGSVNRLKAELDAAGVRTPERSDRGGTVGGTRFARGKLYAMLSNPIYIGRVRHKSEVIPASMPRSSTRHSGRRSKTGSPATRAAKTRARCEVAITAGGTARRSGRQKMRPSHASKRGRRYRYYISAGLIEGSIGTGARGWRIPAAEIESVVARAHRGKAPGAGVSGRAASD